MTSLPSDATACGRTSPRAEPPPTPPASVPTRREATAVWARIGLLSFGGPAAQIALMHRFLVEERGWLDETRFLRALSFCMLLPGPEAMQLATYAGWRLHGTVGGLIAGLLFVVPGAFVVLALAVAYATLGETVFIETLFFGVRAAVLVVVVQALVRVASRALAGTAHHLVATFAFVSLFFLALPYPLVILVAALVGAFLLDDERGESSTPERRAETTPGTAAGASGAEADDTPTAPAADGAPARAAAGDAPSVSIAATSRTVAIWLAVWWLPLLALEALTPHDILGELARFFSTLAVVTFGGAYAVLAYLAQDIVARFGWLTSTEVLDALALAETTPGPLILVTEFVGFLAAFRAGGLALGLAGALVTLWVTFVPCFLWIFAGAPYLDWLSSRPRLRGALAAITAAVVGVMLNLSLWFALHVLFGTVEPARAGPLTVWTPEWSTLDWRLALLTALCAVLTFRYRWDVMRLLAFAAVAGAALLALG